MKQHYLKDGRKKLRFFAVEILLQLRQILAIN